MNGSHKLDRDGWTARVTLALVALVVLGFLLLAWFGPWHGLAVG